MRYIIGLIALAFLLSGCGKPPQRSVDPALAPVVDKFAAEAKQAGVELAPNRTDNLIVHFASDDHFNQMEAAYCENGRDGVYLIEVRASWYAAMSNIVKEQVVYHELGHCLLSRGHRDDTMPGTDKPVSIMNSSIFFRNEADRPMYIAELFTHLYDWHP